MEKELRCRDVGLQCETKVCAQTEEELLTRLGKHVLDIHGLQGFSREFYNRAQASIHQGDCNLGDAVKMTSEDCIDCYAEYDYCDECCC